MDAPIDRRDRPRVRSSGTAIVERASGDRVEFAIRDVSASGAMLVGNARLIENEPLRVTLDLHGVAVQLIAIVVRTDPPKAQTAIAFRGLTRDALESIERAIGSLISRARAASPSKALLLHADADVRAALERDLARLGRGAISCASILEAMWAMQDPARRVDLLIASDTPRDSVRPLLQHFAEHHPQVRRVLLFGAQLEPIDHATSNLVTAVLRTPWRIRPLARALGIDTTDSSMVLLPTTDADDA